MTGKIIADDLCMNALEGSLLERAERTFDAGADLAIVSFSNMQHGFAGQWADAQFEKEAESLLNLPKNVA
jgi:hypothetical protein